MYLQLICVSEPAQLAAHLMLPPRGYLRVNAAEIKIFHRVTAEDPPLMASNTFNRYNFNENKRERDITIPLMEPH